MNNEKKYKRRLKLKKKAVVYIIVFFIILIILLFSVIFVKSKKLVFTYDKKIELVLYEEKYNLDIIKKIKNGKVISKKEKIK